MGLAWLVGEGIGMDAMTAFEDFNSLPGMVALEGWFTNVLWIVSSHSMRIKSPFNAWY